MSINYKEIKSEQHWKASTGLSFEEFLELAKIFEKTYEEISEQILDSQKMYLNTSPKFKTCEDMLFFALYSIHSGLSYDLLGVTFGMDTAEAFKSQSFILRILIKALEPYHVDSCLN